MKLSEIKFLNQLEKLGKEQALLETSSPLPEWSRPLARILGEKPWQVLLLSSFVLSALLSVWFFPWVMNLFNQGVLSWLLR